MTNKLIIAFDADMIVFRATAQAEKEIQWSDDLCTLHSELSDAKAYIDDVVMSTVDKVLHHYQYEGAYDIVMCLSGNNYYRKQLLPTYKLNREGKRKPLAYARAVDWVKANYTYRQCERLEADDLLGILGTDPSLNTVIVSGDKDMRSIPCRFYDLLHDMYYDTTLGEANYWHLYQTLVGDLADNYKGCPKVGEVGATKLLSKNCKWQTVVDAYEKQGLTADDALLQARVAYILRYGDYNPKTAKIRLWTPATEGGTHIDKR